ncbi:hypothetical protein BKA69DRAFT_1122012 [Paraphysoderma sedebokerense]|nr:hypothetical protein BKA69DRAFT_1122012 [Paraphysoderma sedebokerense]
MYKNLVPFTPQHTTYIKSLYKRCLRSSLDWSVRRNIWRQEAMKIRYQFEENRNVTNPMLLEEIISETEKKLADFAHPEPYRFITSPSGSKYNRNPAVPKHIVENGFGDYVDPIIEYGKV